ncbi:MAG TPA: aldehyde dehydrogenase [Kofleriaceae bacterium]|jgi:acyl-CoA reductase-like NAD-dependent aldehyde dehydrogenase|nr:aldehyde dehydrogenase [Kofleriaceae bacterium]
MSSDNPGPGEHVVELAGIPISTAHWIGGRRVTSRSTFDDRCPIDDAHLARVSAGGKQDVEAAVDAARRAFPAWAKLGPHGRLPILQRFADGIRARTAQLAAVETLDNGSLLAGNAQRTVPRAALNIEFFARRALGLEGQAIESPDVVNHLHFDPAGVVALITPWNAPLLLTTWKLGPALAAGNTIVVKPPEWAPLTCSMLADIAHGAGVPPGVINVVQGIGEQAGAALVDHPDLDRISFTGSTDTAKLVGQAAARTITPFAAELGGKSPLIVCADADLEAAAHTVALQYLNAGQVCLAGTRVVVEHSIAAGFLETVRAAVLRMRVGDPRDRATRIGPLITEQHYARVAGFVERAVRDGARLLWGGHRAAAGRLYHEATMFADVDQGAELMQREVFGPVLTWQTFRSDDEVIELANATRYGLAATIFSRDEARARRIAAAVVAGTVWVNCYYVRELAAPFGGSRDSGLGREGGDWSFHFYCDVKNVVVRRSVDRGGPDGTDR